MDTRGFIYIVSHFLLTSLFFSAHYSFVVGEYMVDSCLSKGSHTDYMDSSFLKREEIATTYYCSVVGLKRIRQQRITDLPLIS